MPGWAYMWKNIYCLNSLNLCHRRRSVSRQHVRGDPITSVLCFRSSTKDQKLGGRHCLFEKSAGEESHVWIFGGQRPNQFPGCIFRSILRPHHPAQENIICILRVLTWLQPSHDILHHGSISPLALSTHNSNLVWYAWLSAISFQTERLECERQRCRAFYLMRNIRQDLDK
jgi:hypothetical protein